MPYDSIADAKKASFPTAAEGIDMTLEQVNKLAELYDSIIEAGTAKNSFSVAWTAWKKLYKKADDAWAEIKTASVQFGVERFVASIHSDEGVPDHAAMIEGKLIHLDKKNLKGWGVTASATQQIIDGIPGIPIRACNNIDPHACDFSSDNFANVGYATNAHVEDGWLWATAAVTDPDAAKKLNDGTWMPFGAGGWSVTGFPSDPAPDFDKSGLTNGFSPASIALIIGNGKPAFEGSGFEMVAAAIQQNNDHKGDTMVKDKSDGGESDPTSYTQEELDAKVAEALEKQKTEDADAAKEAADVELAKQKTGATDALIAQKAEFDATLEKLTAEEKTSYEEKLAEQKAQASGDLDATIAAHTEKLAEMTSKDELATILEAHGQKVQADILDGQERQNLIGEYRDLMQSSPIAGAPFADSDGVFNQELFDAEMPVLEGMQTASLAGMVNKARLVVAAVPGRSAFDAMNVPGQPPGSTSTSGGFTVGDCKGGD